ncbi:MAG TPA: HEAT repeat domain-containing protein, partial [Urbifossiella sp.]|nr:HEAT repeat domain-containing protein [Urbifossiella sp.]
MQTRTSELARGRIAGGLLLLITSATISRADEEPKPRPLIGQQVQGLRLALDDPMVQLEALKWCAATRAGQEELFQPIRKLSQHSNIRIRQAAIPAVAVFKERAVEVLIPLLGQSETRLAAAEALGRIGEKAEMAVEQLAAILADPQADIATRRAAVEALGRIGEKAGGAVGPLIAVLTDPQVDDFTSQEVTKALERIGAKAVDPLITALKDPRINDVARKRVAEELGRMGAKAVDPLTTALKDPKANDPSRRAVIAALGRIGEKAKGAVGPLVDIFSDPSTDYPTRREVAGALEQIGG